MKRLSRVALLICVIGSLIGCAASTDDIAVVRHETWSEDVWFSEWPETEIGPRPPGLSVGYMYPEERHKPIRERTQNYLFHIPAGAPFTTRLLLRRGDDVAPHVAIAVFVNYQQVPFSLDGRWGLVHYAEILPVVVMEIPLEVPIAASGQHDLFVVVFSEPEGRPIDPQTRLPISFPAYGRRTAVCVETCHVPEPEERLPEAWVGKVVGVERTHVDAMPLLPDDGRPTKERLLLAAEARPGAPFALELWARNPSDTPREYVIVPVLNFQQTAFAGESLLRLRMPPGSELFLPGSVQLPKTRGTHELQFIVLFDPYAPLDRVRDESVWSPMSSALIVK